MPRTETRRAKERRGTPPSLAVYLESMRRYPLLTPAEERALGERIRARDAEAVDALVCGNLRFVVSVARKYQHQGVPLADLINEGNLGLMRAAHRFDETKGSRFISYAVWWIRQAILQALAAQSRIVRVPVSRAGTLHRIGRHASLLLQELGRDATDAEIAQGLDVMEAEVTRAKAISRPHVSLDAPVSLGDDGRLQDYLPDASGSAPDEETYEKARTASIESALAQLRAREARILRLYFGLDGDDPMTLEQIGRVLGITRERVRQLEERALRALREGSSGAALRGWTAPRRRAARR